MHNHFFFCWSIFSVENCASSLSSVFSHHETWIYSNLTRDKKIFRNYSMKIFISFKMAKRVEFISRWLCHLSFLIWCKQQHQIERKKYYENVQCIVYNAFRVLYVIFLCMSSYFWSTNEMHFELPMKWISEIFSSHILWKMACKAIMHANIELYSQTWTSNWCDSMCKQEHFVFFTKIVLKIHLDDEH